MSAQKPPAFAALLPVATLQTARGLLRIHARLRGELAKAKDGQDVFLEPDDARAAMGHIAALMPLLGVRFDPSAMKPIRTLPKIGPLGYGDVRAGILAALRASGGWMTCSELADAVLAKHRVTLDVPTHAHFLQKLREAAHALASQDAVERESALKFGEFAGLQRWRLSQRLFRPR